MHKLINSQFYFYLLFYYFLQNSFPFKNKNTIFFLKLQNKIDIEIKTTNLSI